MHDGRIVGDVPRAAATERTIGLLMAGIVGAGAERSRARLGWMARRRSCRRSTSRWRWRCPRSSSCWSARIPLRALRLLATGAFGNAEAIGYTLYYATSFVFTGLAVAVAFHGGLFNIGAEGQAYIAGLGVALLCLGAGGWPTAPGRAGGRRWRPAPLAPAGPSCRRGCRRERGSHVVITTIMFNFIASARHDAPAGQRADQAGPAIAGDARVRPRARGCPQLHEVAGAFGLEIGRSPLNLSSLLALLAGALVWLYLWHTRWGYELRALGHSEAAAVYGGIVPARIVIVALSISGALAGLMSLNEVMGVQHRLLLNFPGGAGYVGIAVALMGRNHPLGIVLAAILFGGALPGGHRAVLRHADAHPRHGRGHPGADHPRVRRVRARAARGRSRRCSAGARREPHERDVSCSPALLAAATARGAAPLVLAALGGLFAERSGIVDLGLEGKMLASAFAAAATAAVTGSAWVGLGAAVAAAVAAERWRTASPASPTTATRSSPAWRSTSRCRD